MKTDRVLYILNIFYWWWFKLSLGNNSQPWIHFKFNLILFYLKQTCVGVYILNGAISNLFAIKIAKEAGVALKHKPTNHRH